MVGDMNILGDKHGLGNLFTNEMVVFFYVLSTSMEYQIDRHAKGIHIVTNYCGGNGKGEAKVMQKKRNPG